MPDISKCADAECPWRRSCWRFMAPDAPGQSYTDYERREGAVKCRSFLPVQDVK